MTESRDLIEARMLLERFEKIGYQPEGIHILGEALVLLGEIIEDNSNKEEQRIANNIFSLYAHQVEVKVQNLLESIDNLSDDEIMQWWKVMREFENQEINLPQSFHESSKNLISSLLSRYLSQMSPSDREKFIQSLNNNK